MAPSDLMFPRVKFVLEGERFLAAAPVAPLCKLYKEKTKEFPSSFLDLCSFTQELSTDDLSRAHGVWVRIVPGQFIITPPGLFFM